MSRTHRARRLAALALTIGLTSLLAACPSPIATPPGPGSASRTPVVPERTGKTLLAIYMMGSTLEAPPPVPGMPPFDFPGAASAEMMELIGGYKRLSEAERANIDVLVGFGGAPKADWTGIKDADMAILEADMADDRFGNAATYLHRDDAGNMGDPATLQAFMTRTQQRAQAQGCDRIIFAMWDHGVAYLGMGQDKYPGRITPPQIAAAFAGSGLKADIIGFDACLMANFEVAQAMKVHGRYMLASAELEPGHGWDYTRVLSTMARHKDSPTLAIAKGIVDGFIDSPMHAETSGKTLSVVDLGGIDAVAAAVTSLSRSLSGNLSGSYAPLLKSTSMALGYGKTQRDGEPFAVDLRHLSRHLQSRYPAAGGPAGLVGDAVAKAVVYNRQDGSRPNSFGLSIYGVTRPSMVTDNLYTETISGLPDWFRLVSAVVARGLGDTEPPTISGETAHDQGGRSGYRMTIHDAIGLRDTRMVAGVRADSPATLASGTGTSRIALLLSEEADVIDETTDTYFLPKWDGTALRLTLGSTSAIVPAEYESSSEFGSRTYTAEVTLNGRNGMLKFYRDTTGKIGGGSVLPYAIQADGTEVPSKETLAIGPGDKLAFRYLFIDPQTGDAAWETGPVLDVSQEPVWEQVTVSGQRLYFLAAEDLKGNLAVSTLRGL